MLIIFGHLVIFLTLFVNQLNATFQSGNDTQEKCYGPLGCFGIADFADLNGRPITFLPQSPEEMNITFKLFTSENPYTSIDFRYNFEQFQLQNSPFDARKKVKFIIHGFVGSFDEMDWMGGIKDLILEGQPNIYNVFGVDWSNGAKTINYFQAVANTRVVGAAIAHFIKKLNQFSGLRYSNVHLIGHSLGSHISGYAGERIRNPQIGRITGLDPAGPSFYKNSTSLRLDPTDANYVDAIHTDYGNLVLEGLGIEDPLGDIDFYPNGGYRQPACGKTKGLFNVINQGVIKGIAETVACNHQFAPRLMLVNPEQLTENCQFVGYQCSNYEEYEKGKCTDCGKDGKKCAVLSIFGETDRGSGQAFQEQKQERFRDGAFKKYYYKTGDKLPYCLHHYGIEIHLANNSESGTGSFTLDLEGSKRKADKIKVSETFSSFKPGETYTFLVTYEKSLGPLRRASMKWTFQGLDVLNPIKLISHPKMIIDRLEVKYMSNIDPRIRQEESAVLCPEQTDTVSSGDQLNFIPCRGGDQGVSRFNNGQTNPNRPQGNNEGSWNNDRNRYTTPRYPTSTSRYQNTPNHYNTTSRYSTTPGYYSSTSRYDNNLGHHGSTSRYSTTPGYYSSTSRYENGNQGSNSRFSTTPGYYSSTSRYDNNLGHHGSTSRYQTTPEYPSSTSRHENGNQGSNSRFSTTPGYYSSTSRYDNNLGHQGSNSRYSTTPGYYSSTSRYDNNLGHQGSNSRYSTTPGYYSSTSRYQNTPSHHGSTSRYQPSSTYHTPSNFHASFDQRSSSPSPGYNSPSSSSSSALSSLSSAAGAALSSPISLASSLSSSVSSWNRRPVSPSLWTSDESAMRPYFRPYREQNRPSLYSSSLSQSSSDPRVKLHLGDNVGEIYRNLGERSFFTSDLAKPSPARVNQKFDEMFKSSSTPDLFYSSNLKADQLNKPIVIASNSRSPGSWRDTPDRRFGELSPDQGPTRLSIRQRVYTNTKVLNFDNSHREPKEEKFTDLDSNQNRTIHL